MQIILDVQEFKALFGAMIAAGHAPAVTVAHAIPGIQIVSPAPTANDMPAEPEAAPLEAQQVERKRRSRSAGPTADKSEDAKAPVAPEAPAPDLSAAVAKIAADAGAEPAPIQTPASDAPSASAVPSTIDGTMFRLKLQEYFKVLSTKPWSAHCAKPENGGPFKTINEIITAAEGETPETVQARVQRFYGIMVADLAKAEADKAAAKAAG
jgi:hypothetical protein